MRHKEYSKQERIAALKRLPQAAQDIFVSEESAEKFHEIMKRYGLRVDEIGALSDEVNLVLVGLQPSQELLANIQDRLRRPDIDMASLARDINEMLIKPVRDSIIAPKNIPSEMLPKQEVIVKPAVPTPAPMPAPAPTTPPQSSRVSPMPTPPPAQPEPAQQTAATPAGIEHTLPSDVAKTKLEQSFRIPPQTTTTTLSPEPTKTPSPASAPEKKYSVDPYREPIQ